MYDQVQGEDDEEEPRQPPPAPSSSSRSPSRWTASRWKELFCSCEVCKQCLYLVWRVCCCCLPASTALSGSSKNSGTTTTSTGTSIWMRRGRRAENKRNRGRDGVRNGLEEDSAFILQQPTDGESSVEDDASGAGQPRHGSTGSISIGSSGYSGAGGARYSGSGGVGGIGGLGLGSDLQLEARRRASSLTSRKESTITQQQYLVDYKTIDYWSGSINSLRSPGDILVQQPQPPSAASRRDTIGSSSVAQGSQQLKPDPYYPYNDTASGGVGFVGTDVDNCLGSIHFYLHYDISTKTLLVKIIEAKDLPRPIVNDASKQDQSHSNPYVKMCLLPNQKDSRQTTLRKKTQHPAFNEQFTYELTLHELERRTLSLIVKDFDKYSRHRVVGQVILPFHHPSHHHHSASSPSPTSSSSPPAAAAAAPPSPIPSPMSSAVVSEELMSRMLSSGIELWRHLERVHSSTIQEDLGEILFSLCYLPGAGRLNVDILRAKQLLPTDLVGGAAPYVRVTLLINNRPIKTKKTTYKKYTLDPVFNESLSFDVNSVQLAEANIVMTVLDFNGGVVKDNFIGRIVLGKESSGSHEVNHWKNMIQSQRTPVAQWHSLKSQSFCDELCPSSKIVSSSK